MATITAPAVNTSTVSGRRRLRFHELDDIVADVDALAAGGYRQLGNWSLGQMSKHLALGMMIGLDGVPVNPPWPVRFVARTFIKPKYLRSGGKPGFKLKAKAAKALVPSPTSDADGIAELRKVLVRFQSEPLPHPHPYFGILTPEEWNVFTLRHAEMHLSFLVPN
jgi:hypothetical protein